MWNPFARFQVRKSRRSGRPLTWLEALEDRQLLTTFDVLNNNDSGPDSFRQAILDANANAGADTIEFHIVGSTVISPTSALPNLTDPVTIDGSTQSGFAGVPLVVIDGSSLPSSTFISAFEVDTTDTTLRSLVIQNYVEGAAIIIGGFGSSGVSGNHVEGCYIGTSANGMLPAHNAEGIIISHGAQNNVIGGTSAAQQNVISGNIGFGIVLQNDGTTGNVVIGNAIGVSADKSTALPNGNGMVIGDGASNNTIGGVDAGDGNLISGNTDQGILISDATTTGNTIQGNLIGTNAAGTAALGAFTDASGIAITTGAHGNLIGGTTSAARNVIAGITGTGIRITEADTTNNTIQGNYIGTDITGTVAIPIADDNIFLDNAAQNLIGGSTAGAGNVISGAARHGVVIFGADSTQNQVLGNRIGTNAAGTAALPNTGDGVRIDGASSNTIGGATTGAGNLISGNLGNGVTITNPGASSNSVVGNLIGVQADGTSPLQNHIEGVEISAGATSNTIGGLAAGEGNVIAFNGSRGVNIFDNATTNNLVLGNAVHDNSVYEIDLNSDLTTRNDAGDTDTGPNSLQNFPVLSTAVSLNGSTTIRGTLNSTPNSVFQLVFYASANTDSNGFGQAETVLGTFDVLTDANGNGSFTAILPVTVPAGHMVTATAGIQSTSELSAAVGVTDTSNGAPVLSVPGHPLTYHLGNPPLILTSDAVVADGGSPNFNGGRLIVTMNPKGKGKELLSINSEGTGPGRISFEDGIVQFGGTTIGKATGGKGKKPLIVTLNDQADAAAVQQLVRNITFQNTSKKVKVSSRGIQLQLVNAAGHSSGTTNLQINYV